MTKYLYKNDLYVISMIQKWNLWESKVLKIVDPVQQNNWSEGGVFSFNKWMNSHYSCVHYCTFGKNRVCPYRSSYTYRVFQKSVPDPSSSGAANILKYLSIQKLPQKRSHQSIYQSNSQKKYSYYVWIL